MRKMQFNYEVYFRQNCIVPVFLILFCVVMAIFLFRNINVHCDNIKDFLIKNKKAICFSLIIIFLISVNVIPLARGGIYLFSEKESDAVEISGVIEETFEIPFLGGAKYGVEQNYGRGEGIVVSGMKYYLMTYGDLKKGDGVSFKFLPQSRLILEISEEAD